MKNQIAIALKQAADKNLAGYSQSAKEDPKLTDIIKKDYKDLITIANMIEKGEDAKKIARAMWSLDTSVRDVIPDDVYYTYVR